MDVAPQGNHMVTWLQPTGHLANTFIMPLIKCVKVTVGVRRQSPKTMIWLTCKSIWYRCANWLNAKIPDLPESVNFTFSSHYATIYWIRSWLLSSWIYLGFYFSLHTRYWFCFGPRYIIRWVSVIVFFFNYPCSLEGWIFNVCDGWFFLDLINYWSIFVNLILFFNLIRREVYQLINLG